MIEQVPSAFHVDLVEVDEEADLQRRIAVVRTVGDDLLVEIAAATDDELAMVQQVVVSHRDATAIAGLEELGEGQLIGDWLVGLGPHEDADCPFAEGELIGTAPA
jgi:hypothetical protein